MVSKKKTKVNGVIVATKPEQEVDIFALLEQVEKHKQPAIDKLLADRAEIDKKLAMLGHGIPKAEKTGRGRPAGSTNKAKVAGGPSDNFKADVTCKVCKIPGHSTRAHNFHPEKFTDEELTVKGYKPPSGTAIQGSLT